MKINIIVFYVILLLRLEASQFSTRGRWLLAIAVHKSLLQGPCHCCRVRVTVAVMVITLCNASKVSMKYFVLFLLRRLQLLRGTDCGAAR